MMIAKLATGIPELGQHLGSRSVSGHFSLDIWITSKDQLLVRAFC